LVTRGAITWGPAGIWAAVLFLLSSTSSLSGPSPIPFSDKIAHLILYTVLGATLAWGRVSGRSRLPHVLFVGIGMLYGLSDEWHQSFVPGRDSSVGDLAADIAGLVLGYTAVVMHLTRKVLSRG
jgi:VanZ family protein